MELDSTLIPGDDRPRGVLTQADREFLRGKKEFASEQSSIDARYRIRQRIRHAILDFSVILYHLGQRDRRQIFDAYSNNTPDRDSSNLSRDEVRGLVENTMFASGVSDTIAFLYLGMGDANLSFEPILESAIEAAEEERGYVLENITVDITLSRARPDTEQLRRKLENGEGLTEDELKALIRSGEFEFTESSLDHIFQQFSQILSEDIEEGDLTLHFDVEEE